MKAPVKTGERPTSTVRLGVRRDVRLPAETVRLLRLRVGAKFDVLVSGDAVVLVPVGLVPKDQKYFWTSQWQRREQEAEDAIARGDVIGPFADADEAIEALRTANV